MSLAAWVWLPLDGCRVSFTRGAANRGFAVFHDLPLPHQKNSSPPGDRGQAVRNDEEGRIGQRLANRLKNGFFGIWIERRSCLVENQDSRTVKKRPGNGHSLTFSVRKIGSVGFEVVIE